MFLFPPPPPLSLSLSLLFCFVATTVPLKKSEDIDAIFSVVAKLYIHHKEFSGILRARVRDWESFARLSLGDIFIQHTGLLPHADHLLYFRFCGTFDDDCRVAGFLELYTGYINNYDNSLATLNRCKKEEPLFAQFVGEVHAFASLSLARTFRTRLRLFFLSFTLFRRRGARSANIRTFLRSSSNPSNAFPATSCFSVVPHPTPPQPLFI